MHESILVPKTESDENSDEEVRGVEELDYVSEESSATESDKKNSESGLISKHRCRRTKPNYGSKTQSTMLLRHTVASNEDCKWVTTTATNQHLVGRGKQKNNKDFRERWSVEGSKESQTESGREKEGGAKS